MLSGRRCGASASRARTASTGRKRPWLQPRAAELVFERYLHAPTTFPPGRPQHVAVGAGDVLGGTASANAATVAAAIRPTLTRTTWSRCGASAPAPVAGTLSWVRIENREQLEALRSSRRDEHHRLDFKGGVGKEPMHKMAEDIAAFANAFGGTLLVGVVQKDDKSLCFDGMTEKQYGEAKDRYRDAVKDHVSPTPMVHYGDPILVGDGDRVVLPVFVEPYIAGLVGARYPVYPRIGTAATRDPEGSNAWLFPVRKGSENVPLKPEQFPQYMDPKIRRAVVLLGHIAEVQEKFRDDGAWPAKVYIRAKKVTQGGQFRRDAVHSVEVHPDKNVVRFAFDVTTSGVCDVAVPLDDVETIFEDRTNEWHIYLRGRIAPIDGRGHDLRYFRDY